MESAGVSERFGRWLLREVLRGWIPFLLLVGIAWLFSSSIDRAGWVSDDSVIQDAILLGLLTGWALSGSHFRGWISLLYCLDLSILIILAAMANLFGALSPPFSDSFFDLLAMLNPRIWTLVYRVTDWYQAIAGGRKIGDTGFFIFLVSLVCWNVFAWLVWSTLRRRKAFDGLLPAGFFLAFNVHLSSESFGYFYLFIILSLFLYIRTHYIDRQRDWDRRQIDYPEGVELDWAASGLALTLLISSVVLAASIFGAPEGWKAISRLLQKTREQTSQTVDNLFSGVKQPATGEWRLDVKTPDLGNFQSALPQGQDVIMWVKTSDPNPSSAPPGQPPSNFPHHYWRNRIYTTYSSSGWGIAETNQTTPSFVNPSDSPHGRYPLTQEFNIVARHGADLFAANQPVQASGGAQLSYSSADDTVLVSGKTSSYQVVSWASNPSAEDLNSAGTDYPVEIVKTYLQLPENLPGRVQKLADQIIRGQTTPFQKAVAIQNYLRQTYRYQLDVKPPPQGQDFVDSFLFVTQEGYCSHFATAMAVLLRTEGIPSRVATGYAMGDFDPEANAFKVIVSSAHAWVEVFFPGLGWVEFEPTPSQSPFRFDSSSDQQHVTTPVAPTGSPDQKPIPWLWFVLIGAMLLLVIAGAAGYWILIRSRTRMEGGQAARLYWRVRRMLAWAGLNAPATTTPAEFFDRYLSAIAGRGRLVNILQNTTRLYQRAVFSPNPPDEKEIVLNREEWRHAWKDWFSLWYKRLVNRG